MDAQEISGVKMASQAFLTTDAVPERDRFECWRDMIRSRFVDTRVEPIDRSPFRGLMKGQTAGELTLTRMATGAHRLVWPATDLDEPYVMFSLQLRGTSVVEQDNREARTRKGELFIADTSRPYQLIVPTDSESIVVHGPRRLFPALQEAPTTVTGRTIGDSWAPIIFALIPSFAELIAADQGAGQGGAPHVAGLLDATAAALARSEPVSGTNEAIRQRVASIMRQRLADPNLDATSIAQHAQISRRTLYRVFVEPNNAEPSLGIAAHLRALRLDTARNLLRSSPELTIETVARRCGFRSASTFHRAFLASSGTTPADYRETV